MQLTKEILIYIHTAASGMFALFFPFCISPARLRNPDLCDIVYANKNPLPIKFIAPSMPSRCPSI